MIGPDQDWLEIFEEHFRGRRKGFLVFDKGTVLRYISDYALEVLEAEQYQIGYDKLSDIITLPGNVPDLLLDQDNFFQTVHNLVITTPAGRSKEVRINFAQEPGKQGMVVWIEPRGREISGTLKKVSVYDQLKSLKGLFDGIHTGFLLLDVNGVVIEYNDLIKHMLRLSGEWRGKVIFTYPPLQEKKIKGFINKCLQEKKTVQRQKFRISYSSGRKGLELELNGMQVSDPRGESIGALICAMQGK